MAIDGFYWVVFAAFAVPAALLELQGGRGGAGARGAVRGGPDYVRFRTNYLAVFGLMMAGDWLQGPYVYHLYEHYGFSVRDIGRLFIAGFASSAVFGTVAGALADKYGRKRAALLYVATYALSCATKHSPHYGVLLLGRVLGGIATSLLFSVFEAWAVAAHAARGFEESLLADLFTRAVMLGNGVMAIAAGLVGSWLVQGLGLGPVAPFDAAILVLLLGGAIIALAWEENRGSGGAEGGSLVRQFHSAAVTIAKDERVALLGVMQALFEASMYTFVFLWTPALNPHTYVPEGPGSGGLTDSPLSAGARLGGGRVLTSSGAIGGNPQLPHGLVFAIFMTASMVGTAVAGRLMAALRLERVLQGVFWAGAVLLFVPVMYHTRMADHAAAADVFEGEPHTLEQARVTAASAAAAAAADGAAAASVAAQLDAGGRVQLIAFCGFEVLIGLFWPSMMALRARYVPEEQRSTIINIFRVPLNAFVCLILWKVSDFPLGVIFALCCLFLVAAGLAQARLAAITAGGSGGSGKRPTSTEAERRADARGDAVVPGAAAGARSNGSTLMRPAARSSAAVTAAAPGVMTPGTALAAAAAGHQAAAATAADGVSPRVLSMAAAGPGGPLHAVGASQWWSALLGGDRGGRTSDSTASPAAPGESVR